MDIRGLEIYKQKLIIYGAGDFVNDYEKIPSHYNTTGAFYIINIDDDRFDLASLQLLPVQVRRLRCESITDPFQIQVFKDAC